MQLDTLNSMHRAIGLYKFLGFVITAPFKTICIRMWCFTRKFLITRLILNFNVTVNQPIHTFIIQNIISVSRCNAYSI